MNNFRLILLDCITTWVNIKVYCIGRFHSDSIHPCGRFTLDHQQGECDFKWIDILSKIYLKVTHPLLQSTTEGVETSKLDDC